MREIVGKMRLEEMVSDRQKFAELVKENAEPDLAAMGLDIISFNVQNFVDSNQVIENLGIDNIVKIKKSAAIARANSEKEIKIAQARANKEANDERVLAETEIAKKNNDLAIKSAELKKESDIKKAEADAAYKIQEEQQRKELEITSANANIARQEREVELRTRSSSRICSGSGNSASFISYSFTACSLSICLSSFFFIFCEISIFGSGMIGIRSPFSS